MLRDLFLKSATAFPDRPALEVAGQTLTYRELFQRSAALAATLAKLHIGDGPALTAVFGYRSVTAFSGVLATLLQGHGYVPLNRTFPIDRSQAMLIRSGCRALIVDEESAKQLPRLLESIEQRLLIILPDRDEVGELSSEFPKHHFIGRKELISQAQWQPVKVAPDSIAYLLFTSGSTGTPKGVMVSHANVHNYVDFITQRFSINEQDRFSQTFDMTFDLSVADMFVAWNAGACLCCLPEKILMNPGRFINDSHLTIWFSVPSTAAFMKRLGSLKKELYPKLRVSLFCGEALPMEVAKAWSEAAPHSIVENVYGPTELTIACTYYRWDATQTSADAEQGLVPIGYNFPNMVSLIVDESLQEVPVGESGELLMTGAQLSLGYWNDPQKTAAAFVKPPGHDKIFYRTGDRVRRPADGKPMNYLGRMDNQIKILGHRVELGEIEAVVRKESGLDGVVAIGWPRTPGGAGGIEIFVQSAAGEIADLRERVAKQLPVYMVPRKIHYLSQFPLNVNGKYDRIALTKHLEQNS